MIYNYMAVLSDILLNISTELDIPIVIKKFDFSVEQEYCTINGVSSGGKYVPYPENGQVNFHLDGTIYDDNNLNGTIRLTELAAEFYSLIVAADLPNKEMIAIGRALINKTRKENGCNVEIIKEDIKES